MAVTAQARHTASLALGQLLTHGVMDMGHVAPGSVRDTKICHACTTAKNTFALHQKRSALMKATMRPM